MSTYRIGYSMAAMTTEHQISMRRALLRGSVIATIAAASACVSSRNIVLEVRDSKSLAPIANTPITITYLYGFRVGSPPPELGLVTDSFGRLEATIPLHEPVFKVTVSSSNLGTIEFVAAEDLIDSGKMRNWSRDSWNQTTQMSGTLAWRMWFVTDRAKDVPVGERRD